MKVTVENIGGFVGKKVILQSIPETSFHYGEPYTNGWIGQEIIIRNTLGDIVFTEGQQRCTLLYGFEVKEVQP
jgi:hypothetical protein